MRLSKLMVSGLRCAGSTTECHTVVLQEQLCRRNGIQPPISPVDYSAFQSEDFPDELDLPKHIPFRQPPHLAFPDHV
jgi:hypothetical protein